MKKTILVVDDSLTVREQLVAFLESSGFATVQARDGQDGLEKLKMHKIDLVIADVNMPRMDGLSMIYALRKEPTLTKLPVFMLTTESGTRVAHGKSVGATGWIVKPYKPDSLLAAIKKVLGLL